MPKVNKKINAVVELDTDTDDESIIKVTAKKEDKLPYVSPVLNSKQFSLYKSSNTSFCDKNGAPFCPDCPSGLELSTMVDKNGLFVCADKHRVAISARGAFVIRRDKYVDNGYIFPVCDKCNRSLMNVTANVASAYFGKVFFTCSCPGAVLKDGKVAEVGGIYVMAYKRTGINKDEKIDKITDSFSDKYIDKFGTQPEFSPKLRLDKRGAAVAIYSTKI